MRWASGFDGVRLNPARQGEGPFGRIVAPRSSALGILQALAFARRFEDETTMGERIKLCSSKTLASQHLGPILKVQVCRHDTCEGEYKPVSPNEVPKGTKTAEWSDPEKQSKLKTRSTSPVSIDRKAKGSGCAGILLLLTVTALWVLANAM